MDDGRKHQRCSVHWRCAVGVTGTAGLKTVQCKANDVSLGGVSVICPLNVFPDSQLTVYLLIDPGGPTHPQVIFEAQGKVMNNVLSSKDGGFRLGIQFTKFAGDSKELLKKHLPKDQVKPARLATGASPAPTAAVAEAPVEASEAAGTATEEATPPADAAQSGDATPGEALPAAAEAPPEGEPPGQA